MFTLTDSQPPAFTVAVLEPRSCKISLIKCENLEVRLKVRCRAKTNSSHLKIGHPKRKLVFQPSIFRGYVSFREGRISKRYFWKFRWQNHVSRIGRKMKWWHTSNTQLLVPSGDETWWNEVPQRAKTETVWQLHVHVGLPQFRQDFYVLTPGKPLHLPKKRCRRQAAGRFRPRHHHPAKPPRDWWHSFTYNWLYCIINIFQICTQNASKHEY